MSLTSPVNITDLLSTNSALTTEDQEPQITISTVGHNGAGSQQDTQSLIARMQKF